MRTLERKLDTRRKIQLGGLIVKAKLDNESTAVLYGALLELSEKLQDGNADEYRYHWRLKGDIAFTVEDVRNRV